MRDSLFLEDLQLSPALACEGNHSSSPLPFLQHCQISAESGRRNCLETSPWLAVMQQFLSGFAVPKCWVCPWAYWIWRDVHCWLALKLRWIEDVCQLLANNASPLVQFMEKLKKEQVQTRLNAFSFFLAVRGADIDLQYTEAMRERAETLRSLEVCKSYSVLWVLPTFDLMLISPTACWASVITCCPKQQNPSSSVENDAFCLVPKELLFPVYQLSANLHFNWILMFEPNYTYWVTGAPSEKRLTGLKCKCSEDDGQSEPLTSTMQNLTSCAKIAHSAVTRNIFGFSVCGKNHKTPAGLCACAYLPISLYVF